MRNGVEIMEHLYYLPEVASMCMFVVTPHICNVSVCLSICYHFHDQTDKHTDLNFGMSVKWKDI